MNVLHDAVKLPLSMKGQAVLQWGWDRKVSFPEHSIQMPEEVIDQIIKWRDGSEDDSLAERLAAEAAEDVIHTAPSPVEEQSELLRAFNILLPLFQRAVAGRG